MWLAKRGRPAWRSLRLCSGGEEWRTGGVLCGHGSASGGQLPHGAKSVLGSWCGKQLFLPPASTVPGVCFVLGCRSAVGLFQAIRLFSLPSLFFSPHSLTGGARHGSSELCGPPLS